MKNFILTILFLMLTLTGFSQQTITGFVTKVSDGDTYTMQLADGTKERIRLQGIDAPESKGNQPYWQQSRNYLARMIDKKNVTVTYTNRDRYGRILGTVSVENIEDVNLEMIKAGLAWHYVYFDHTKTYADAELSARQKHLGLWQDKNPINPYEWRQMMKK